MKQHLYHYTSIDSLKKILSNKSLRFTSLDSVDDLDEVETADLKNFGRFCFVSCWTCDDSESIPMWKMYTPDMQGVRIKMTAFPFKKYIIHPGEFSNQEPIETYINARDRHEKNLPYILNYYPELIEVDYTEKEELLYPKIKTEITYVSTESNFESGQNKTQTQTTTKLSYDIKYIGVFKRKCWAFQKEWRYKIFLFPYTYREYCAVKTTEDHFRLAKRLEETDYKLTEENLFLDLDDKAISEMEILIGPKATEDQVAEVTRIAILSGIDPNNIKKSTLRIR